METISWGLRNQGFSQGVIERVVAAFRESTNRQYQSVWKLFLNFLSVQGIPHSSISVPVVCEFLDYCCTVLEREYRTVAAYKCALRHPLLWACGVQMEGVLLDYFMKGVFNFRPPQRAKVMPAWSLNHLLNFLKGSEFEPLERASPLRLTQKVWCLLLLASGRRKGEVANLSRSSSLAGFPSVLSLHWVSSFVPKHHTPEFRPPCPSVCTMSAFRDSDRLLCPVRAYGIYFDRSLEWLSKFPVEELPQTLWSVPLTAKEASVEFLSQLFKDLVKDSRSSLGLRSEMEISVHQTRKFAASYSIQVGHDEQVVRSRMGFSEVKILRKNYVAPVPPLQVACVLPGGSFLPVRTHELSDSDSD